MREDPKEFFPSALSADALSQLTQTIKNGARVDPLTLVGRLREEVNNASANRTKKNELDQLRSAVASSLLADLVEQGWSVTSSRGKIFTSPPTAELTPGDSVELMKARVREGLQRASNRQLSSDSVRQFIQSMEKDRVFKGDIVSIRSLIDDGRILAPELQAAALLPATDREERLAKLIQPYIQVCDDETKCKHTGLWLLDVWRYFRHTWTLEYNPLPGRTLRVLIRNKARPKHPIIGIALLASPAANLYSRDKWIGWRLDDLMAGLVSERWSAADAGKALFKSILDAMRLIRTDDLLSKRELKSPSHAAYFRLEQIISRATKDRQSDLKKREEYLSKASKLVDIRSKDKSSITNKGWRELSSTSLFRKKRAELLLPLLRAREFMKGAGFNSEPAAALYEALVLREGQDAIKLALNENRKKKLATEIADISVCGSIAPYNHLLGGKLVALLMASAEVQKIYRERYSAQTSEIASQVAGRKVVRPADLRVITTTSLYGIGSSQYNRLKLLKGTVSKLARTVEWEELDLSEGFTVTHLSKVTVSLMKELGGAFYKTSRINSVFGEGSSPRTRQVREGLNLIGINNDSVLRQSIGRRVYACELYTGAREDLVGFKKPQRRTKAVASSAISSGWLKRWVDGRIQRPDVIEKVLLSEPAAIGKELRQRADRAAQEEDAYPNADAAKPQLSLKLTTRKVV